MSCFRTPQLTEIELLMALDGEADPEVTMHLTHCPDCRVHAGQLQKLQTGLTSRFFRIDCPSSMDVGEYQLGLLPGAQALAIEKHQEIENAGPYQDGFCLATFKIANHNCE